MKAQNPRPHTRKYQDEFRYERNMPYLRQKAQAVFRGETWILAFEDWCNLWTPERWVNRGKGTDQLCMTRIDLDGPWSVENSIIMVRYDSIIKTKQWLMAKRRGIKNGTPSSTN